MANQDNKQESTFSWLNIMIILIALLTVGYFLYTQHYLTLDDSQVKKDYSETLSNAAPSIETEEAITQPITQVEESQPITFFETTPKATTTNNTSKVETAEEIASTPRLLLESSEEIEDNYTDVLQASDQSIYGSLAEFSLQTSQIKAALHEDILRNTVVFIENFSNGHFVSKFSPMLAPGKPFLTQRKDGKLVIDPRSYQRYDIYTDYINSVDSKQFVQYYLSLKPSIDDFYAEIAKPNSQFDDALTQSINMVLATPVIYSPIEVNSPSVMYLYDDPALENLNDAQKLLLRIGPQNLAKLKHKLRSIQAELTIAK